MFKKIFELFFFLPNKFINLVKKHREKKEKYKKCQDILDNILAKGDLSLEGRKICGVAIEKALQYDQYNDIDLNEAVEIVVSTYKKCANKK